MTRAEVEYRVNDRTIVLSDKPMREESLRRLLEGIDKTEYLPEKVRLFYQEAIAQQNTAS